MPIERREGGREERKGAGMGGEESGWRLTDFVSVDLHSQIFVKSVTRWGLYATAVGQKVEHCTTVATPWSWFRFPGNA